MRIWLIRLLLCAGASLLTGTLPAAMTVSLQPSFPEPGFLGDTVIWQASASGAPAENLWFRFRVRDPGGSFRTIVDFGPGKQLQWTPCEREGLYEVEVTVRNRDSGDEVRGLELFRVLPRVRPGQGPVISNISHPLVFLYSAEGCTEGANMRVEFESRQGDRVSTPAKPCVAGATMNFLLAGMRSGAEYTVRHFVESADGTTAGPPVGFVVPPFDVYFNQYQLRTPPSPAKAREVLLQGTLLSGKMTATDLEGNLLWYYSGNLSFLTRPCGGGTFLGILQQQPRDPAYQLVREFDLTGTTVRETNAARVSEQLKAMGKRSITAFHHEAETLPGGRILALGSTEQILTDVQGPGPVNVLGEMIVVLDRNLQVEWAWDAFDHIDPARAALHGETCGPGAGGCPPYYLTQTANDWLHANSVRLTPDGNLLMSIRHLDWVVKIDYANGRGTGAILWRLGKDGDFRVVSDDPAPWFSHQHDATVLPGPDRLLTLFDNGNTRYINDPSAHSRGQMYKLDEENRVATLVYNVDLGVYSLALGSAQRLEDGNFHFDVGWIQGTASRSVETDSNGLTAYEIEIDGSAYRTFRIKDLYAR